jgi:hypothetical protein
MAVKSVRKEKRLSCETRSKGSASGVGVAGTAVGEGWGVGTAVASVAAEVSVVGRAVTCGRVGATEGSGLLMATGGCAVTVARGAGVGVGAAGIEQPTRINMTMTSNR